MEHAKCVLGDARFVVDEVFPGSCYFSDAAREGGVQHGSSAGVDSTGERGGGVDVN